MCIRINGDINDVAEMYLDNELRSIKSFLEEVLDLPGRPTINELLGAVKHELHEDEEVETKEKSVFLSAIRLIQWSFLLNLKRENLWKQ